MRLVSATLVVGVVNGTNAFYRLVFAAQGTGNFENFTVSVTYADGKSASATYAITSPETNLFFFLPAVSGTGAWPTQLCAGSQCVPVQVVYEDVSSAVYCKPFVLGLQFDEVYVINTYLTLDKTIQSDPNAKCALYDPNVPVVTQFVGRSGSQWFFAQNTNYDASTLYVSNWQSTQSISAILVDPLNYTSYGASPVPTRYGALANIPSGSSLLVENAWSTAPEDVRWQLNSFASRGQYTSFYDYSWADGAAGFVVAQGYPAAAAEAGAEVAGDAIGDLLTRLGVFFKERVWPALKAVGVAMVNAGRDAASALASAAGKAAAGFRAVTGQLIALGAVFFALPSALQAINGITTAYTAKTLSDTCNAALQAYQACIAKSSASECAQLQQAAANVCSAAGTTTQSQTTIQSVLSQLPAIFVLFLLVTMFRELSKS